MSEDPLQRFAVELERAAQTEPFDATRAALATVSADGVPSVRFVLVKEHGADGFVFYTNYDSPKAHDLDATARAALAFHWASTGIQVRVRGPVTKASADRSDAYFATRPRGSQLGAWASPQSRPIESHAELEDRVKAMAERFGDGPIPRPPFWGGYVLAPEHIEFWRNGDDRLHERLLYQRRADRWIETRLAP